MATRQRTKKTPVEITQKDRDYLTRQDFLGRLTPEEIKVAKCLGIFKWNDWAKRRKNMCYRLDRKK